jgi:hypothetical protein
VCCECCSSSFRVSLFIDDARLQELLEARLISHAARRFICCVRVSSGKASVFCCFLKSSCSYGPFNYGGSFTTDSNRRFDGWLKSRSASSGIRDFEAVRDEALKVI